MAQWLRVRRHSGDGPAHDLRNGRLHNDPALAGATLPDERGELPERDHAIAQDVDLRRDRYATELRARKHGEGLRCGMGLIFDGVEVGIFDFPPEIGKIPRCSHS